MFQDEADPEKIQRLIYIVQSPNILCPQTSFSPFRQFFQPIFHIGFAGLTFTL